MDGDLLRSWSPALSRPRCSNRRDHHGMRGVGEWGYDARAMLPPSSVNSIRVDAQRGKTCQFLISSPLCCRCCESLVMAKSTSSRMPAAVWAPNSSSHRPEQDELLPSGRQSRFANRVAWAKVYLERGGLLESPQRGRFMISPRGREVLNTQPARIDVKFLAQYPEFVDFQKAKRQTDEPTTQLAASDVANAETPEEGLVSASWWICF